MLSGALFGGYYYYNADNDEETEIRVAEADAGVIYEPSEVLRFGFGLGYADRTRDETEVERRARRRSRTSSGPVVRANLRYTLPEFTVVGNVRWTTASAEDNHFSGSLGGFYALPRGMLTGRIYQLAVGNASGERGPGDRRDDRARPRDQLGEPASGSTSAGRPRSTSTTRRARHHPHRLHR